MLPKKSQSIGVKYMKRPKENVNGRTVQPLLNEEESLNLEINVLELDREWSIQPRLARKWNAKLAAAEAEARRQKDQFEFVEAELTLMAAENPEEFGIRKSTKDQIEAAVICHKRYQHALRDLRDAEEAVGKLKSVTIGLEHKKKGLEKEVDLWMSGYFAEPRNRDGSKEAMTDMTMRRQALKGRKK